MRPRVRVRATAPCSRIASGRCDGVYLLDERCVLGARVLQPLPDRVDRGHAVAEVADDRRAGRHAARVDLHVTARRELRAENAAELGHHTLVHVAHRHQPLRLESLLAREEVRVGQLAAGGLVELRGAEPDGAGVGERLEDDLVGAALPVHVHLHQLRPEVVLLPVCLDRRAAGRAERRAGKAARARDRGAVAAVAELL